MAGGEWAEELADFVQAGDLNPNGVIIGLGATLPPPLDTYLIAGIVYYSAGNVYGYTGIRFNGVNYITEDGLVLANGVTIVPINYRVAAVINGDPGQHFLGSIVQTDAVFEVLKTGGSAGFLVDVGGVTSATPIAQFFGLKTTFDSTCVIVSNNAKSLTPSLTGGAGFALGNSVLSGSAYTFSYDFEHTFELTWGSTGNSGTGGWTFGNLPPCLSGRAAGTYISVGTWDYVKPASTQRAHGNIFMNQGSTTFALMVGGGTPTLGPITTVGAGVPEVWATGAILTGKLNYRADPTLF